MNGGGVVEEGSLNFREFGAGCPSRFGATVRSDRLYRGGAPAAGHGLARFDFHLLGELRHPGERHAPSVWPAGWEGRIVASDAPSGGEAPHLTMLNAKPVDASAVETFYLRFYRTLPFDLHYQALFGSILNRMAATDGRCFIYCAAGKDRTGMLAALIGHVLGMSEADIMADYMRSAHDLSMRQLIPLVMENARKASGQLIDADLALHILGVRPAYLQAMLDQLMKECGSIECYLDSIGVAADIRDRIRNRFIC